MSSSIKSAHSVVLKPLPIPGGLFRRARDSRGSLSATAVNRPFYLPVPDRQRGCVAARGYDTLEKLCDYTYTQNLGWSKLV